jgi:hypothetical protein
LITGISGATANQAKKQTKNAIQLKWKARICGVEKEKSWIRVAFPALLMTGKSSDRRFGDFSGRRRQLSDAGPPV